MANKIQIYRDGVAIAVGVDMGITMEEAKGKLTDHYDLIDSWFESGVPFTVTAALVAAELKM